MSQNMLGKIILNYSTDRKFLQSMPLASITFVSNMDTSHWQLPPNPFLILADITFWYVALQRSLAEMTRGLCKNF